MSESDERRRMTQAIETGVAGLWRFYDDGFVHWPREKLASLFSNVDIESPLVRQALTELEAQGRIRFVGRENCYIEVISAPLS